VVEVEVHDEDSSERIYEWGEKEEKGAEKDSLKNGGEPPAEA
jgi:hypothetical protein